MENKEAIVDEIKRSLSEVGVLPHINSIGVFLSRDFAGKSKFNWAERDVTE